MTAAAPPHRARRASLTRGSGATVAALLLLTLGVFVRAFVAEYVTWDDNIFILENGILGLPFTNAAGPFSRSGPRFRSLATTPSSITSRTSRFTS